MRGGRLSTGSAAAAEGEDGERVGNRGFWKLVYELRVTFPGCDSYEEGALWDWNDRRKLDHGFPATARRRDWMARVIAV